MIEAQARALSVRQRLMTPPNAVEDRPLEMKNGRPVKRVPAPVPAKRIIVINAEPPQDEPPVPLNTIEREIARLRERANEMRASAGLPMLPPLTYPEIKAIKIAVANHYGVTVIDMDSGRRTKDLVRPRHVAMYLAKTMTLKSLPEVGRRFGGRDHTTVLWAVRKIAHLRQIDGELNALIVELTARLAPKSDGGEDR